VEVDVVVSNLGTVVEPHVAVQFTMALVPAPGRTAPNPTVITARTSLPPGASTTVAPATFGVEPGRDYQLTVAIVNLHDQSNLVGTQLGEQLQIAPST
jgi:hypothetical protein